MFLVKVIDFFVGAARAFGRGGRNRGANQSALGAIGAVILLVAFGLTLYIPSVVYRSNTAPFTALLGNASGLTTSDPVYVNGIPKGRIEKVSLDGSRVRIEFRLDEGITLGSSTSAAVRLKTLLGKRYLSVTPSGSGDLGADKTIPESRTTPLYSLDDLGRRTLSTADQIDPAAIKQMMRTVADELPSSRDTSAALSGVTGTAATINESGDQIHQLLTLAKQFAQLLNNQRGTITKTVSDARTIMAILDARREAIANLSDDLQQVLTLMNRTFPTIPLGHLTGNLVNVTNTLATQSDTIAELLRTLPPALRSATNSTGNGNWTDVSAPSAVIPDTLLCMVGIVGGCK